MNKRKGVLTVEAAIILPVFIMVMVFVLSFLKLCYFHLVMQQSLQNVGRTLAQYGYVIDGLYDLEQFEMKEDTKKAEQGLVTQSNAFLQGAGEMASLLQGGITLQNIGQIITEAEKLGGNLNELVKQVKSTSKEELLNYLMVAAMNGAGGKVVEWMIGDYLSAMGAETGLIDHLTYQLYIVSDDTAKKDMLLVADYDYKFPFFSVDVRLRQCVRFHPWIGGPTSGVTWEE